MQRNASRDEEKLCLVFFFFFYSGLAELILLATETEVNAYVICYVQVIRVVQVNHQLAMQLYEPILLSPYVFDRCFCSIIIEEAFFLIINCIFSEILTDLWFCNPPPKELYPSNMMHTGMGIPIT